MNACDLKSEMRMLWEEHVAWTRMTIISIAENLPDLDLVIRRLLRNPIDMANVLQPFYGPDVAAKFIQLFTEHLTTAAELVQAAKAGNTAKVADARKRWYANADQIALFFSSINPFWSQVGWRALLYDHLAMTEAEAVYRLQKKYAEDIAEYDQIEQQALVMADTMSIGMIKQFPGGFMGY